MLIPPTTYTCRSPQFEQYVDHSGEFQVIDGIIPTTLKDVMNHTPLSLFSLSLTRTVRVFGMFSLDVLLLIVRYRHDCVLENEKKNEIPTKKKKNKIPNKKKKKEIPNKKKKKEILKNHTILHSFFTKENGASAELWGYGLRFSALDSCPYRLHNALPFLSYHCAFPLTLKGMLQHAFETWSELGSTPLQNHASSPHTKMAILYRHAADDFFTDCMHTVQASNGKNQRSRLDSSLSFDHLKPSPNANPNRRPPTLNLPPLSSL